jgi:hypothetical protein
MSGIYEDDDNGVSFDSLLGSGKDRRRRDVGSDDSSACIPLRPHAVDGRPVSGNRAGAVGVGGESRTSIPKSEPSSVGVGGEGPSTGGGHDAVHRVPVRGDGVGDGNGGHAVPIRPVIDAHRRSQGVHGGAVRGSDGMGVNTGGGVAGAFRGDSGSGGDGGSPVGAPRAYSGSVGVDGDARRDGVHIGQRRAVRPAVSIRHDANVSDDARRDVSGGVGNVVKAGGSPVHKRRGRGKDRHKRAHRERIGDVVMSSGQSRIVDRVNRNRRNGENDRAFVFTERDQRVFDFLVRWRFASRLQVLRVGGWRGFYGSKSYRLNEYRDLGFATIEPIPLERLTYAQLTSTGVSLSRYAFLGAEPPTAITSGNRSHSLGLSSLASQLLSDDEMVDDVAYDVLGLGADGWKDLRREIRSGDAKVVSEREYRSSWSRIRKNMASPSAVTDVQVRGAMAKLWNEEFVNAKNGDGVFHDTFEYYCCDPEYEGETAWLWTIFGSYVVRDKERNKYGRPAQISIEKRALDDKGKPVLLDGDRFALKDHLPDMVIARHRGGNGRPHSLAIELELTAKSEKDYDQTMAGFMSKNGKLLYEQVIWLVVQGATANLIRHGAERAGAVEGVDYRIVPVASVDERSSYYNGADMRPGELDVFDSGEYRGYSTVKDVMRSIGLGR